MAELHMKRKFSEDMADGVYSGDKYFKWTNMGDPPPGDNGTMYGMGQNTLQPAQNGMMVGYHGVKQETSGNQCNTTANPSNPYGFGYNTSPPVSYSNLQNYSNGPVPPGGPNEQLLNHAGDGNFQFQQHFNTVGDARQYTYNHSQNQIVSQQNATWAPNDQMSSPNMQFRPALSTMHQMPANSRINSTYNYGMQESQPNRAMSYPSGYLPPSAPGYTQIKQEPSSQGNEFYPGSGKIEPSMNYYGNVPQQGLQQGNPMVNSSVPVSYQMNCYPPGSWSQPSKMNSNQQGDMLFSSNLISHDTMPNSMVSTGQYGQVFQSNNPPENSPFMSLLQSSNFGPPSDMSGNEAQYNHGQNSLVSLQNCSQIALNNTSGRFLGGIKQEFPSSAPIWAADGPMPKCIPETNLAIEMNSRKIPYYNHATINISEEFLKIELDLCRTLCQIPVGEPVTHIYNPLEYAYEPHSNFVQKYCTSTKPVLFLGMNPGPFGMVQSGIPFGEVSMVKNWLKITGTVYKPQVEHPQRLIKGMECTRSEVSGARFWGFLAKVCKEPEVFFQNCFIHNLCPLSYMSKTGKNITPPQLKVAVRKSVSQACATAFCRVVRLLDAKIIVGIGRYAQQSAQTALQDHGIEGIRVESIMHPSPINPAANKGWEDIVTKQLEEMGLMHFLNGGNPVS